MKREEVTMKIKTAVKLRGLQPAVVVMEISHTGLFPAYLSSPAYDQEKNRVYEEEKGIRIYALQEEYFLQEGQEYTPKEYDVVMDALDSALIDLVRGYQDVFIWEIDEMTKGGFNYNFTPDF